MGPSKYHCVSYPSYITGAKFEQHHSNIYRHILDFVIYFCTEVINHLTEERGGRILPAATLTLNNFFKYLRKRNE